MRAFSHPAKEALGILHNLLCFCAAAQLTATLLHAAWHNPPHIRPHTVLPSSLPVFLSRFTPPSAFHSSSPRSLVKVIPLCDYFYTEKAAVTLGLLIGVQYSSSEALRHTHTLAQSHNPFFLGLVSILDARHAVNSLSSMFICMFILLLTLFPIAARL